MTTIRTKEQLSDSLSADLAWRKKELADLKSLIDGAKVASSREKTLLRSGITILYAHWEGFVKTASSSYLQYVAMQRLKYSELSNNFVALALKTKLAEADETNRAVIFTEAIAFIRSKLDERSSVPYKDVIKTGANLSSNVFRDISYVLGLDYSLYETKQNLIDEKLLFKRNNIAHGEYLQVEKDDYLELHSQVIGMMDTFRNQIENCATSESYKLDQNV